MSLQSRLTGAGLTLGLLVTFSMPLLAQQSSTTQDAQEQQQTERMGKKRWHRGKHGGRGGPMRMFRELGLSEAQQQQAKAIMERYEQSNKPQRDEMRQLHQQMGQTATGAVDTQAQARAEALRTELRESRKRMHDELLTILTPDQRAKLEQMKQERKARHEERRNRRQIERDQNQQDLN
jgi:periplasmic protein CpxP/Spy